MQTRKEIGVNEEKVKDACENELENREQQTYFWRMFVNIYEYKAMCRCLFIYGADTSEGKNKEKEMEINEGEVKGVWGNELEK